jgi:6-phosphogluconate dehydrogenase
MGVPAPTIAEAVFARCISAIKDERVAASKILKGPSKKYRGSRKALLAAIHDALYCSKICSYAQGFQLMRAGAEGIQVEAELRRDRPDLAGRLHHPRGVPAEDHGGLRPEPDLANLLLDPYFNKTFKKAQANWRKVIALSAECGVPAPTFSASLAYYDGYRSARLPANLLQAQRDFFGAHTYERVDQPRGKFFHLDWPDPKRPQPCEGGPLSCEFRKGSYFRCERKHPAHPRRISIARNLPKAEFNAIQVLPKALNDIVMP